MHKFHIKSILLGIGMGIVLTAIISIIYLAGNQPTMGREEIIEKARQYGMFFKEEVILIEPSEDAKNNDTIENKTTGENLNSDLN
ncbi:hypothetical protein [Acetivibrio clariflavus]|uniref:hypothetical protein n=1 Tax=Acetivibrio clariflavus TaxID=288965 RepID=UPI0004B396E8|nr:hypothetical protein [Acetivibrio clariflavus]